jgi:2-hydroxy-3-oxopropionate reductase
MTKIGFIGMGIMGKPMAKHLIAAGYEVYLHSRSGVPEEMTNAGGIACQSSVEVAQRSDIIILMLPETSHVASVLFDQDGVASGLSVGKTVVDMSSISPMDTKIFAKQIQALDCHYVDAPVSGGEVGAKAASLTIMVGADEESFERVLPVFELMGKNITRVGNVGAGQICKVANQIIVALNIEAVSEALVFASKMGADPEKVRKALMGGFASSKILEVHGERMVKRTFDPGFRIKLHQKDLDLALSNAKQAGIALPNTATAQELFNSCAANGGSEWDHSALIKALEMMSNHSIA